MAADRKADEIAIKRKCMRFKEINEPEKYQRCMRLGKEKLNKHYAKMKAQGYT